MTTPDRGRASGPTADTPNSYLGFVGVSTGSSSIRRVFPRWAEALQLPTRTLRGHDVALAAQAETYRRLVQEIRDDPQHWGALITTHKMAVYEAAGDLFDEIDELAHTFGEVSSIAKRDGRLIGSAKDPITARLALEEFVADDHFAVTGGAALVLGSGGAGTALSHQLAHRTDRPKKIICTALDRVTLDHARATHERSGLDRDLFDYELADATGDSDRLLAALPPGSLVVNATGMGKDRPGSPISDGAVFPEHGIVWEFNYRGTLEFWQQATSQQQRQSLRLEDGWRYFVHGWTQVIAEVFDISMPPATVAELSTIAAGTRS